MTRKPMNAKAPQAKRNSAKRIQFRCYCCGGAIGARVALVTMQETCDRVFIMSPEHAERVQGEFEVVTRTP
jgi:hypothetical protein